MKKHWPMYLFGIIFLVALIARLFVVFKTAIPWWDETIYIGMAKYLFSNGQLGYWEMFRPPVIPFILGLGWKVGLGIFAWGKFLTVVASLGVVLLTYLIGEKVQKHAGLVAVSLVALLPVFFSFGNKILSGIPATCLLLLGIYLFMLKKWYWSGLIFGVAFLTRFVTNTAIAGVGFAIFLAFIVTDYKSGWLVFFKKAAMMLVGFFTLVVPYMIFSLVKYGHALAPMIEGSVVFTQYNNFVYDFGNWYYFVEIFKQNPLLYLFVVGIVAFIVGKKWVSENWNLMLFPMIGLITYFFIVAHKEIRFFIPIFPFMAILTGLGIMWVLGLVKKKSSAPFVALGFFVISIIVGLVFLANVVPEASLTGDKDEFYHYFENASVDDSLLIASNPLYMVYTDKPITFLRSWILSEEVMRRYGGDADFVAADLCDHPCEEGSDCENYKEEFVNNMDASYEREYSGNYVRWDAVSCDLVIWKK